MLNELIDVIGYDEVEKGLSNIDVGRTVALILKNDSCKVVCFDDKETLRDLEEKIYIKDRFFYTRYLSSNKAVVQGKGYLTGKLVLSSIKYAISFNISTFYKKLEKLQQIRDVSVEEYFDIVVNEYYDALATYTDDVTYEKERMLKFKDSVIKELKEKTNRDKCLSMFIEASVDSYIEEFDKYLSRKIFDEEIESGVGRISSFMNLNGKKPLLSNVGSINNEIQIYDKDMAIKLYKTKFYMDFVLKTKNRLERKDYGGSLELIFNVKDKVIEYYDQNPYIEYNDDLKIALPVTSVCCDLDKEFMIETYSMLVDTINRYCGYAIGKEHKDGDRKLLYNKYKAIIQEEFVDGDKHFYRVDKTLLRKSIHRLMNDLVNYNKVTKSNNKGGLFKMAEVINLKLLVNNYFDENGGCRMSRFEEINESFKKKIVDSFNMSPFNSVDEAMYAAGQLANYLNRKSKGKQLAKLIGNYHNVKTYGRVTTLLKNDIKKYEYAIDINGKELLVFAEIKKALMDLGDKTIESEHMDLFEIGLFGKNMFYTKIKKSSNDEGLE